MELLKYFIIILALGSTSKSQDLRIINGTNVKKYTPYVSSLYSGKSQESSYFLCGASFINSSLLITAAHCVDTDNDIKFFIGYNNNRLSKQVLKEVKNIIIHPFYNPNNLNYDIAILELEQPANVSKFVELPTKKQFRRFTQLTKRNKATVDVFGWGTTITDRMSLSNRLQGISIPAWASRNCRASLGRLFNRKTMLCGSVLSSSETIKDGLDSCYGDSGGPLVWQRGRRVIQLGVVSWGFECASAYTPGVYTNVFRVRDWILKYINNTCNFFSQGDVKISPRGSLRIGRITMQRKGGTPDPTSLQFKINPLELFAE